MKILAINPGSTSTKIALFEGAKELWSETQRYGAEELAKYPSMKEQLEFRDREIRKIFASKEGFALDGVDAFVGRGGLLHPIDGGTYKVTDSMIEQLISCKWGTHASNMGAPLASRFAASHGKPAFIVDPVVVDEMPEVAHVTGLPEMGRKSIFHALNQKAVAHRAAKAMGRTVTDCNFIVCHMGGGVSVGAHRKGRVVEVNDALGGEGPMSPERAGSLPASSLVDLCFSNTIGQKEIAKKLVGAGGFAAHLGTTDFREVMKRVAEGDAKARLVYDAFCYQLKKYIGVCAAVLEGNVDAIILTGGLAYNEGLCADIRSAVSWIAKVVVHPGEDEMQALAEGALRVLNGSERAKDYV